MPEPYAECRGDALAHAFCGPECPVITPGEPWEDEEDA